MVDVGEGERITVGVCLFGIVLVGIMDGVTNGFGDGYIIAVRLTSLDGLPHPDKDIISRIVNPRGNLADDLITAFSLK